VISVSPFPSTAKGMESILQNEKLVSEFLEEGSPIAIRAILTPNKNNPSGYEWTSSDGPESLISAGTLVKAMITVKEQKPISLLIPAAKKLIGS